MSLDFSSQENDNTDLVAMVDALGRSCSRLQNIHVASIRLSHAVVLALTGANLRLVEFYNQSEFCYLQSLNDNFILVSCKFEIIILFVFRVFFHFLYMSNLKNCQWIFC